MTRYTGILFWDETNWLSNKLNKEELSRVKNVLTDAHKGTHTMVHTYATPLYTKE